MFGNSFMVLNKEDSLLGISKCKDPFWNEVHPNAQRWDCLWIGVSNYQGEVDDTVRLLYDMNNRKRYAGVIIKPFIITDLDYKGLNKE